MTGVVVRIRRGERFVNVDFDELTDREMDEFLIEKSRNGQDKWIRNLAALFARWIRDNVHYEENPS